MSKSRIACALALALSLGCGKAAEHSSSHGSHAGHAMDPHAGHAMDPHAGHTGHEGHTAMAATRPASDTSVFQLTTPFTDQLDHAFAFESLRGHPTLIAMFYGSCETVCPILLEDMRAIESALEPERRASLRVVLITFDPERDTAERLRALAAEKHFDATRWTFLRGSDDAIREVSMVLGVQYRRLPDGNFSHSALISLLDPDGNIVERIEGLHGPNEALLARIRGFEQGGEDPATGGSH